jgi:chromosome segregation ATPase
MNENRYNLILVVILILGGFAIYRVVHVPEAVFERSPAQPSKQISERIKVPESTLPVITHRSADQTRDQSATSQPVFENEVQRLNQIREKLTALKSKQAQQMQKLSTTNTEVVASHRIEIQNLSDLLAIFRQRESDLNQVVEASLNAQSSVYRFLRDQIDLEIRNLTENIEQLQGQLTYRSIPPEVVTVSQQEEYFTNLQNNLDTQMQQLEYLRNRSVELSAQSAEQIQAIYTQARQQKTQLIVNQSALYDEIFSLRNEINNVQSSTNQIHMSLMPLSQQIKQTEQDYQAQLSRVSSLQQTSR